MMIANTKLIRLISFICTSYMDDNERKNNKMRKLYKNETTLNLHLDKYLLIIF